MKKMHRVFQCIAVTLLFACHGSESEAPTLVPHQATSPQTTTQPLEPSPVATPAPAATPTPGAAPAASAAPTPATAQDKLVCPNACTKISATPPSPACCHCNGADHVWKKSAWSATTWLCNG